MLPEFFLKKSIIGSGKPVSHKGSFPVLNENKKFASIHLHEINRKQGEFMHSVFGLLILS